jgi:archaeal flagellin FlaB
MKNKGMMGIGTLIIFIAVILVAAVAAAVLVSTSGSLQQRGLATGSQAEEGVSTGAEIISVMATDASLNNDVEEFEVMMRLQAGSSALNLENTVILMDTSTTSQNLEYDGVISTDAESADDTSTYKVYYVQIGPDKEDGYLSRGDIVKVKFWCFDCTGSGDVGGIGENQKVRIRVVPRVGQSAIVEFTTPDVMIQKRISLWP